MSDKKFMQLALDLAARRLGYTSPNPMVGAVIVKNNKIIAAAYHEKAGLPHAEVKALKAAGREARGAVMYVTLEPCVHFGKTPPCCDAIIASGIKEVVIASKDLNPINYGSGIKKLKKAGIKVRSGVLKEQACYLNRIFFKFITKKMPFIILKTAQSLDGKIASFTGDSQWITSEESRQYVQKLRQEVDAVLVGVNTVLRDNPRLTVRLTPPKKLFKIIIDPHLKTPLKARLFKNAKKVILLTTKQSVSSVKKKILRNKAEIMEVKYTPEGKLDLVEALKRLSMSGITSILVEGGGETLAGFIEKGLFDEIYFFIAPKIIGGRNALTSVEGGGTAEIHNALSFKKYTLKKIGQDLLIKVRK